MDKDIEKLLKSIERQNSPLMKLSIFYILSIVLLIILSAFMIPTAQTLTKSKDTLAIIPLLFLLALWLYAFWISRKKIYKNKIVSAYGWIFGITTLVIVLMLYYLQSAIKG